MSVAKSSNFWELIQHKLGCEIPKYLVNTLSLRGFDNMLSIKQLDEEDIIELQTYVRSEKFKTHIPKDANLQDYFGSFYETETQTAFEILPGHKKLLNEVILFVRKISTTKGSRFFGPSKRFSNNIQNAVKVQNQQKLENSSPHYISNKNRHEVVIEDGGLNSVCSESVNDEGILNEQEMEGDIIALDEQKTLFEKIEKWILKWLTVFNLDLLAELSHKINCEMVILSGDSGVTNAKVLCPICDKLQSASKTKRQLNNGVQGKLTWNISNYTRHVSNHNCTSQKLSKATSKPKNPISISQRMLSKNSQRNLPPLRPINQDENPDGCPSTLTTSINNSLDDEDFQVKRKKKHNLILDDSGDSDGSTAVQNETIEVMNTAADDQEINFRNVYYEFRDEGNESSSGEEMPGLLNRMYMPDQSN